jgi:formamidopyrimidine-DNA glycosylase
MNLQFAALRRLFVPELPDIELYLSALRARTIGRRLERIRIASPFVLRSVLPPISAAEGKTVRELRRLGKRIVFRLDDDLFLIVHLMIAGRLRWRQPGTKITPKIGLAAFDFENGTLLLTEASSKKRASLHLVSGDEALRQHNPGGVEVLDSSVADFTKALRSANHTVKRALTDPRLFSGIGNAYSDEILHRAKLSPAKMTLKISDEEAARLHQAIVDVMTEWTKLLQDEVGEQWPEEVTAFRPQMAVHGKFKQPCPVCGTPVQRIVYAENEANYCPACQTGGKLLADRAMSRLLKKDWPKTLEEMEEYTVALKAGVPTPKKERAARGNAKNAE